MLGAAGAGKTYELSSLADREKRDGRDVRIERLAVLGQTTDGLASRLVAFAAGATESTSLYLDALDEVMVPVKTAGLILARWLRDELAARRPALRVSCRSAVWPDSTLWSAITDVYEAHDCAICQLQPLTFEDVKGIASRDNVDADAFMSAVESAGAFSLSQQPLTLKMLLRVYSAEGSLPGSRRELFAKGTELLASEPAERFEDGTAIDVPLAVLLDAASRLACFSLLSGREVFDLDDLPAAGSLGWLELANLPGGTCPLDRDLLRAVGRSGLCGTIEVSHQR